MSPKLILQCLPLAAASLDCFRKRIDQVCARDQCDKRSHSQGNRIVRDAWRHRTDNLAFEVAHQERDILDTVSQRWQFESHRAHTVH